MPAARANRRSALAQANAARIMQVLETDQGGFRLLLDALPEPVLLASASHRRLIGFNRAAAAMFGVSPDVYGRPLTDVLPFVTARTNVQPQLRRWQGHLVASDGAAHDLDVQLTQMFLSDGTPLEVFTVHDVSHLVEVSRQREQLLYSAAHELRGSITVVDNTLEILISDAATIDHDDAEVLLQGAHRASRRLTLLIDQVLNTATIRAGRFLVHPEPVALLTLIDEAMDAVAPILAARAQQATFDRSSAEFMVTADRRSAPQILVNLLGNASKFSPEGSTISVRVARETRHARIEVRDQGAGISPEQQIGLFDRYVRARTSGHPSGFGLGLAIAREMAEAQGGRIGLASRVGFGTRVWFTLPLG